MSIQAAVRNAERVASIVAESPVVEDTLWAHPAVAYLRAMPGYKKDAAAAGGTKLHAVAEAMGKGEKPDVDDATYPMAEQYYRGFIEKHRPQFHPDYIEFMVVSVEHEYAGTMELACRIGEDLWLLDVKTSTKDIGLGPRDFPYTETTLQLAAGHFADFVGKPDDPKRYAIPPATRFGVIAVTATECELVEYSVTPADFSTFLACRNVWGWNRDRRGEAKRGLVAA